MLQKNTNYGMCVRFICTTGDRVGLRKQYGADSKLFRE